MDVGRTPCVVMIEPRVRTWFYCHKTICTIFVRQSASGSSEIRIQRRGMMVAHMDVPAGRVGLPDLHQSARHRATITVKHTPGHDDTFAQRLARMLTGEIVVRFADLPMSVERSSDLGQSVRKKDQRLGGGAW